MISCLKPPILLNGWKHHLGFVRRMVNDLSDSEIDQKEEITRILKSIGGSQFDLYLGDLDEYSIGWQTTKYLENEKVYKKTDYFKWLDTTNKNFRNIIIDDGSVWTMLKGNFDDYYIHIHPARYSPCTIRVKANPWKSAIASLVYTKGDIKKACQPEIINISRHTIANLEPVHEKFDHKIEELIRLIAMNK